MLECARGKVMKRIVITTFYKAENYGAALQAYALQTVLREKDYDAEILNYRDSAIEDCYKTVNIRRENLYLIIRAFLGVLLFYRRRKKRHEQFLKFQEKYLKMGDKEYWSVEEIKNNPPEAEIYITGSDQVWNTSLTKGVSDIYTLNFGQDKTRRIAYAASIGTKQLCQNEVNIFIEKVSKIDAVSVREVTAQSELMSSWGQKAIDVTLDPVLLRSRKEWESDISDLARKKEKYILAYLVEEDQEYRKIVKDLSKMTGLKIIHFESRKKYNNVLYSAYTEGPLEFVNLIKNAEYVVTTSFHGTAFSIVLHKKFWVVPNGDKASRITDLLEKLQLQDRAVHTLEEFRKKDYDQEINHEKVDILLEKEKEKSLQWLSAAMEEKDF